MGRGFSSDSTAAEGFEGGSGPEVEFIILVLSNQNDSQLKICDGESGSRMNSFFDSMCLKKKIRNASPEQIRQFFPKNNQGRLKKIDLHTYHCVCFGYRNRQKKWEEFQILNCGHTPLLGSHQIRYRDTVVTVNSLTYFRKEILKFTDFVSFDRSTFLVIPHPPTLFRLHNIREHIQLPLYHTSLTMAVTTSSNRPAASDATTIVEQGLPPTLNPLIKTKILTSLSNRLHKIYTQIRYEVRSEEVAKNEFKEILIAIVEENLQLMNTPSLETANMGVYGYSGQVYTENVPEEEKEEEAEDVYAPLNFDVRVLIESAKTQENDPDLDLSIFNMS